MNALENHLAFVPAQPYGMCFVAPHMGDPQGFLLCLLFFDVYKSLINNRKNLERAPTFIDG